MKSLLNKASILFIQLLYGLSLLLPYSSDRPPYIAIPLFSILEISLFVFSTILSVEANILISTVFGLIYIRLIMSDKIMPPVSKLRAERYYRIKIPSEKVDDYLYISDAIDLHRKYGKYGEYEQKDRRAKLRYIEDKELIKEYRRFNRKWEMIAGIYIVLHIVAIYLWNQY